MKRDVPHIIHLKVITEFRGVTRVLEGMPFDVKRIFYITNVPNDCIRGGHAHNKCKQILIAVSGAINVTLGNGKNYLLYDSGKALYIPEKHLIHLEFMSEDAILMVLASENYDEDDYIYSEDKR